MKNAFAIVTLSGLLSACTVAPQQQTVAPDTAAFAQEQSPPPAGQQPDAKDMSANQRQAAAEVEQQDAERAERERLPKVEMTSTMLYQLSKAELEFREGNYQGPYLTMLSLAQQTKDPRLARRAAEMAVAAKQADDALAAVRLWRELDPESDEANQYFVGMVVLSDNIAEAEEVFRQRLEKATPGARGLLLFQIQQLLGRAKDKAAADAMLERLIAPYAGTMEAHVVRAQRALQAGDKTAAREAAQAALAAKPDSEIAVLMLAQVTDGDEQIGKLLDDFLKANPKAREVRAAKARLHVSRKQYAQAREQFEILLKDEPDDAGTLYALGVLAAQTDDAAAAERYLARFVDVLGRDRADARDPTRALLMLSQLAEERKDFKAALQWLEKVPAGADAELLFTAQLRRAQLAAQQGDVAGARRMLAALKPKEEARQAQVVMAEAQILREAGRTRDAYELMQAATKRLPANPDLLYDFALQAEKLGRFDVMEKALRTVMKLAPDNHHAYNALGYSLAERNVRLQEAYELIDKALKMAPGDPFIMDSMGWVHYRMGNLEAAEAHLRRAYALRSDPEIAVHLGEVLWQKGEQDAARKLWREARAKDPRNDTLRTTLARLRQSL